MPFVGSGLSRGLPTWLDFLTQLAAEIADPRGKRAAIKELKGGRFLDAAQLIEVHLGRPRLSSALRRAYFDLGDRPRPRAYDVLARLPTDHWVTTNYDTWLRDAVAARPAGRVPQYVTPDDPGALSDLGNAAAPFVLALHGTAERPETCVLTTDDYQRAQRSANLGRIVRTLTAARHLLFVGYSASDPDLKLFLDDDRYVRGDRAEHRHWSITAKVGASDALRLDRLGIQVIDLDDFRHLDSVLADLARPPG